MIEAMKQALEALEAVRWSRHLEDARTIAKNARYSLRQAIEQAEKQEPVAFETWLSRQHGDPEEIGFLQALKISYEAGQDSAPPRKEWVGLTDDDLRQIILVSIGVAEAKLKEKNGG